MTTFDPWPVWTTNDTTSSTSTTATWNNWTVTTGTGSSASSLTVNAHNGTQTIVWDDWVSSTAATATNNVYAFAGQWSQAQNTVFAEWNEAHEDDRRYGFTPHRMRIGPAERERRRLQAEHEEERRKEQRRRDEERRLEREEAQQRALRLLVENLTEQQRLDLDTRGHFFVDAPSGRRYQIESGSHGNVKLVDPANNNRRVASLCAQPRGVPDGDSMLAQKLLLLCDESAFLRIANHSVTNANAYERLVPRELQDRWHVERREAA